LKRRKGQTAKRKTAVWWGGEGVVDEAKRQIVLFGGDERRWTRGREPSQVTECREEREKKGLYIRRFGKRGNGTW